MLPAVEEVPAQPDLRRSAGCDRQCWSHGRCIEARVRVQQLQQRAGAAWPLRECAVVVRRAPSSGCCQVALCGVCRRAAKMAK